MTKEEKFAQIESLIAGRFDIECSDLPLDDAFEIHFSEDDCNDYQSWKNYFTFTVVFDDESFTKGTLYTYRSEMVHDGFSYSYGSINGFQEDNYIEPKWDTEETFAFSSFEECLELVEEHLNDCRY